MLLRNFDQGNLYYDTNTNKSFTLTYKPGFNGWYKSARDIILGVYVENHLPYLYVDGLKYEITDDVNVTLSDIVNGENERTAWINKSLNQLTAFKYEVEEDYSKVSPFEYLDEEEFDFGLFLKNLINNAERKTNFIKAMEIK